MRPAARQRARAWLALPLLLLAAPPARSQEATDRLRETMAAIAAGETGTERRAAITERLRAAGVEFELQEFDQKQRKGANVIARVPGQGARTLLVGAHYDRVAVGRGVVDNGGACAALVELLRSIKASPLARHTLTVVFFDLEEDGRLGSRAYLERLGPGTRPAHAINIDIFAYGDSIFATASQPDGPLLRALREAGATLGVPVRDAPLARYPGSDHQSMVAAGLDTLGIALIDGAEIDGVLGVAPLDKTRLGTNPRAGSGPRILGIIHSPRDTLDEARPDDVAKGVRVLEQLLRRLDQ